MRSIGYAAAAPRPINPQISHNTRSSCDRQRTSFENRQFSCGDAGSSSMPVGKLYADLEELNERLQSGIETCRSVVANYRSLLADEQLGAGAPASESVVDAVTEEGTRESAAAPDCEERAS
jgi:hypothetical protein